MRLTAKDLAGERGGEEIFADVDFDLASGQALIISGPNGVGKSTLLRVVAGFLPVTFGTLAYEGDDEFPDLISALHYLGHQNAMKPALTVEENLGFWQDYSGKPHLDLTEALEMVGLEDVAHLPFGYLSTGQRRRIAIAKLLVSYRPLWLLDEPTAGLDKASEQQFAALMHTHLEVGGMILAATHLPLGLGPTQELKMGHTHV